MNIRLRKSIHADFPFLREMLYEAVFWRAADNRPVFEEGLAYPGVRNALADWGERDGDTAVVATINSIQVGAAWYRYWTDDNNIRGYIDGSTPVLVISVQRDYRKQGIGGQLLAGLIDQAAKQTVPKISLMVAKDNHAIHLYRQQRFREYADTGDDFIMVRSI